MITHKRPDQYRSAQPIKPPQLPLENDHGTLAALLQRSKNSPKSLTAHDIQALQQTIGNRAVLQLMRERTGSNSKETPAITPAAKLGVVQRQDTDEEEESSTRHKPLPDDLLDILLRGAAIAAWKTFAFQATRTRNVEREGGISERGLQPRYGGTGAASGNEEFEKQSKNKVHYTRDYSNAAEYGRFFKTGLGFPGKTVEHKEEAEILQLSLPNEIVSDEESDLHDERAKTTDKTVPPENIRRLRAERIPDQGEVLEARWQEHVEQSFASIRALESNLPEDAQDVLITLSEENYDIPEIMQLVKQSLVANPASTFLKATSETKKQSLRAGRPDVNSLGHRVTEPTPETHTFSTPSQAKEIGKWRKKEKKRREKKEKKERRKDAREKRKKKGEKEEKED